VTGEWRKLHSGELHNLYSFPDIIRQIKSRRMRWVGHVACMGEGRKVYRVLVGKPEGKTPLGGRGVDGRMGLEGILGRLAWSGMEWIHLAQNREQWRAIVNAVMNLWIIAPLSYIIRGLGPEFGLHTHTHTDTSKHICAHVCVCVRARAYMHM
jgi:hypothetical protein